MEYEELNMGKALDHSVPSLIRYNTHGLIGVEAATAYWRFVNIYARDTYIFG